MHLMESAPGAETIIDGRSYLYFCGTGYLGLQGHAELIAAACQATQKYGLGTATTRAGYGNAPCVVDVERRAAAFCGCQSSFYFPSGYVGNHILLSALIEDSPLLLIDQFAHYSVVDASRFFGVPVVRFAHRDAQSLRAVLRTHLKAGQTPMVLSDGVFAARGTLAPVNDYLDVLREYPQSKLCLDDCHAFGVLGRRGRGTYEHFGVAESGVNAPGSGGGETSDAPELYCVGTLSKAFGGYGGIICGSTDWIEKVKERTHYFQGASAPPTPAAAASAAALELVTRTPSLIQQVQENARNLRTRLLAIGLPTDESPVPIISLTLGNAANMQRIQQAMAGDGVLIAYLQQYSGISSEGAIRIAVFSTHTEAMLERFIHTLERHL